MKLLLLILLSINSFAADTMTRTPVYTETGDVVDVGITGSVPLPTDAATATLQINGNSSLASIDSKVATAANQATANASLASIDGKLINFVTSNATVSSVAASATPVTLLSSNSSRRGFKFYNDSNFAVYVKFGTSVSTTSFTIKMEKSSFYESDIPVYTGEITAVWISASGDMRITEL